ncbi:MAG: hypothetical protein MUC49_20355 [Raineya sp.]|jgi:hypothetical protein|nr:hypothetical protein [Raineya sp.]
MKKIALFLICILYNFHVFGQTEFEKAKLEILCQAIRFNHIMQGKAEVANQLDCSSLQTLEKSVPNASRASKNMITAYKSKAYQQIPAETDKIKQLKKEVFNDLKKLAPRINKSADFQAKWQKGLDSLSTLLDSNLSLPVDETTQNTEPKTDNANPDLEETIIPVERPKNNTGEQSNTGLWIITILAMMISFLSVGYAYLTQKTTAHKLKEMDNLVKERYNHLDVRMDKMLTKEEFRKHNPQ